MDEFILAVDLDGVCAKYNEGLRKVFKQEKGLSDADLAVSRTWGFEEWGITEDEYSKLHDIAVREYHIFQDLEMYESCADVLWRLSDAGAWIRIVTHRLYTNWGHESAVVDTVQWLDKSKIPYRDLCFLGAKSDVDADVFVEDAPHNIERLRAAGREVVVFDQEYNSHFERPRASNWIEIEQLIMGYLAMHQGSVEMTLPGVSKAANRISTRKSKPV